MKWEGRRQSSNVRRATGRKAMGGGIGGIIIALILWLVFDMNPLTAFQAGQSLSNNSSSRGNGTATATASETNRDTQFVKTVLADTETVWHQVFSEINQTYKEPQLILFNHSVQSACGGASAATGPFYCPADQTVYLDTSFFRDMVTQLDIVGDQKGSSGTGNAGKAGDFAQAYVIAHEVGHHVQNLLGYSQQVRQAQARASKAGANDLSVRQELQADCFAGVWASRNQQRVQFLENGDIDEALHAASMIGDDRLAHSHGHTAVPDNFTHGTSEQRVTWFIRGFKSGQIQQCDTYNNPI